MLRLKTFGALAVMRDGEPAGDIAIIKKHLCVLAILAADGASGVTRSRVKGLLWAGSEESKASGSLGEAIYRARLAFGDDVILEGQESMQLNAELLSSDVVDFRQALKRGDLEAAVASYTGPFLNAVYVANAPEWEQWTHARATAFAKDFADALLTLSARAVDAANFPAAVDLARRAAEAERHSARVACALMKALCYAGDNTAALDAYRVYATLVREDLEAEPDPTVLDLVKEIKADRVRPPAHIVVAPAAPAPAAPKPPKPAPAPAPKAANVEPVRPSGEGDTRPSVAVLPFVPITPEPNDSYFSDGMTDAIINELLRLDGLRVCARTTVYQFKNYAGDVLEIGRRLNVRFLVAGTVITVGESVRVAANLISVEDGSHLWLGKYDRDLTDILAIQDEIALGVAQALKGTLTGTRGARLPSRRSVVTIAYERLLAGRHFRDKRNPTSLRKAITCYREAQRVEPKYALAYAAEADTWAAALAYGIVDPAMASALVRENAARALALDAALAGPHAALGAVAAMCDRDWAAAEREFKRALALDPHDQTAHLWYANYCLAPVGRLEEGLAELRRVRRSDPVSPVINCSIGMTLFFQGRLDEAVERFHSVLELDPGFPYANYFLGRAEVQRGHFAAAIQALERTVAQSEGAPVTRSALGYACARSGDEAEAVAILASLEHPAAGEYVSPFDTAFVQLGLGRDEEALAGFERAAESRTPMAIWFGVLPELAHLRANRRFAKLLPRIGLPPVTA